MAKKEIMYECRGCRTTCDLLNVDDENKDKTVKCLFNTDKHKPTIKKSSTEKRPNDGK